jgi:AhpC/TSA family
MNLKQRLEALRKAGETRIPEEARAIMHRATEDLGRSGILNRVVKVGQKAPTFELLNQRGERVSSEALLTKGPLVVSFYRGVW